MIHATCRLTAKNWDQLWNPTLGNRVWATFSVASHYEKSSVAWERCQCGCGMVGHTTSLPRHTIFLNVVSIGTKFGTCGPVNNADWT